MKITLKPLGNIAPEIVEELKDRVEGVFRCPVEIAAGISDMSQAYNSERKQYLSSKLLASLKKTEQDERVVGIVDIDLFIPSLKFVFGEADMAYGTSIISLYRLHQEYYGLASDNTLFIERATKEVVHELGHTFGLGHCRNSKCVMRFSNSLADTDLKETYFCNKCRPKIII